MYNTIIEILKIILPAFITGIITFLITKYNYHKNLPLDKLEIAYNRIYYPIYRTLKTNSDILSVIDISKKYLYKYEKYADSSTMRAFQVLLQDKTKHEDDFEKNYQLFKNNIYNTSSYLIRRSLGYLEPNIFKLYKYASNKDKHYINILIYIMLIYILIVVSAIDQISIFCAYAIIIIAILTIIYVSCKFVFLIIKKIINHKKK